MFPPLKRVLPVLVVLLLMSMAMGCRGSGSSSISVGTTPTASAVTGARQTVLEAFSIVFNTFGPGIAIALDPDPEAVKVSTISPTEVIRDYKRQVICDPKGSGSIDGRVDDKINRGTFSIEIDFNNCSGAGGVVNAVGSFDRTPQEANLKWAYSGDSNLGDCSMDLSNLAFTSSVSLTTQALGDSLVTGQVIATCAASTGSSLVTCTWDGISVNDANALSDACACSGPDC